MEIDQFTEMPELLPAIGTVAAGAMASIVAAAKLCIAFLLDWPAEQDQMFFFSEF